VSAVEAARRTGYPWPESWGRNLPRKVRETRSSSSRKRPERSAERPPTLWHQRQLAKDHLHRYWTGALYRNVQIPEGSAAINAPVGLPAFCHKLLFDNDKHLISRPCSDASQSFPSLSHGSTGSKRGGSAEGATYFVAQSKRGWSLSPKRFLAGATLGGGGVLP